MSIKMYTSCISIICVDLYSGSWLQVRDRIYVIKERLWYEVQLANDSVIWTVLNHVSHVVFTLSFWRHLKQYFSVCVYDYDRDILPIVRYFDKTRLLIRRNFVYFRIQSREREQQNNKRISSETFLLDCSCSTLVLLMLIDLF